MIETIVATSFVAALVVVPLAWRIWRDRLWDRALMLQAELQAAVRRAQHGDSMLSIRVVPATPWHAGRVLLSAPAGWESLLEAAWYVIGEHLPAGYEVVITPAPRAAAPAVPHPIGRAA